jgi:hypothetical protein
MKLGKWLIGGLLAFYLMMPPQHFAGRFVDADLEAPLPEWNQLSAYDTAAECEAEYKRIVEYYARRGDHLQELRSVMAVCVAGNDPRLKKCH